MRIFCRKKYKEGPYKVQEIQEKPKYGANTLKTTEIRYWRLTNLMVYINLYATRNFDLAKRLEKYPLIPQEIKTYF